MPIPKSIPAPPDTSPGLTNAELRASPVPVSGTLTATVAGVSTAANQVTELASLASIDAGIPAALGQTTMAASMPVVIASNQTAIPISGTITVTPTGTQDVNLIQVAGSSTGIAGSGIVGTGTQRVTIATDDAVSTNLTTIAAKDFATQTTLALIKAKTDNIPPLGQALEAASVPVVLTAAQITTLTPPAAITGFATETTLAALNAKVTAVNTGAVVLAAGVAEIGNVKNSGTFVVQENGAALTSLQLIDDAIATAGTPPTTIKVVAIGATALTAAPSLSTGSVYALNMNLSGGLRVDASGTTLTVASHAVTNAGTFAVQATLAAETTKVIGTVNQGTSPWVVSGPLTDTQLRATPVPVSGTLALSGTVSTKTALTASAPTAASVGVASAQAVAAAATRKGLILVNTSTATISLGFDSAAVLNSGVTLKPGYAYNMAECDFHVGAVNAIASAAASNLSVQEYLT